MESLGVYIHIPFCVRKCQYCDFLSISGEEVQKDRYVEALCREIHQRAEELSGYEIRSLFWGGGTPSVLNSEQFNRIVRTLLESAPHWRQNAEWTVEANPGTVTPELARSWKVAGVNRISLGAQAFQDSILKELGRIHNWEQVRESVSILRSAGFDNLSLDLMMGLPNQRLRDWEETLSQALDLAPEHLSCYSLIVEEGTPLCEKYKAGKLRLPEEEEERQMYALTLEYLEQNGYLQYEISNFAKEGRECRHNLSYWDLSAYRGLGLGASSYIQGIRSRNACSLEQYCEAWNPSALEQVEDEASLKNAVEEWMFLGMRRRQGISEAEFEERFRMRPEKIYSKQLEELSRQGLIIRENGRIRLSRRGLDFANLVFEAFLLETI